MYSTNTTTGLITFSHPVKEGVQIVVDFDFDIEARFDTDYLTVGILGDDICEIKNINLLEVL